MCLELLFGFLKRLFKISTLELSRLIRQHFAEGHGFKGRRRSWRRQSIDVYSKRLAAMFIGVAIVVIVLSSGTAEAKNEKGKIRDFVKRITGVTSISKSLRLAGEEFALELNSLFFSWSFPKDVFPTDLLLKAAKQAHGENDIYLYNMARGLERKYGSKNYHLPGMCEEKEFKDKLSPECMILIFQEGNDAERRRNTLSRAITEIRVATNRKKLFVYFKTRPSERKNGTNTDKPVGFGILVVEEFKSHLVLSCKDCLDFTPVYSKERIVMPFKNPNYKCDTSQCLYVASDARVIAKDDEVLISVLLDGIELSEGERFELAAIIEEFPVDSTGFRNVSMEASPFYYVALPNKIDPPDAQNK